MPRRLTKQQSRRIAARQRDASRESSDDTANTRPGLVIARYGRKVLIEDDAGERQSCHQRANLPALVAGDEVRWIAEDTGGGVVVARDPRRSALQRPDARGQLRPIAANIDLMLVVIAPLPTPFANLIDRYLVAAEHENIAAIIVLNKSDLLHHDPSIEPLLDIYRELGYPVICTSREDPEANAIRSLAEGKTLVLVGQSGVGKSSLIKRLLPQHDIRIGELSEAADKGRHTTTAAELFHLPGGGRLIDSPGIREFHLHHLPATEIARGFRDFQPYLGHCRFRDCAHRDDAGCALREAVDKGDITPSRFESYLTIVDSLAAAAN
jgi:ribosome biogenesis GTPase